MNEKNKLLLKYTTHRTSEIQRHQFMRRNMQIVYIMKLTDLQSECVLCFSMSYCFDHSNLGFSQSQLVSCRAEQPESEAFM